MVNKGDRGFVEAVEMKYNPEHISLSELLTYFFKVIDPTLLNKQGNDVGIQYHTGVYYENEKGGQLRLLFHFNVPVFRILNSTVTLYFDEAITFCVSSSVHFPL